MCHFMPVKLSGSNLYFNRYKEHSLGPLRCFFMCEKKTFRLLDGQLIFVIRDYHLIFFMTPDIFCIIFNVISTRRREYSHCSALEYIIRHFASTRSKRPLNLSTDMKFDFALEVVGDNCTRFLF